MGFPGIPSFCANLGNGRDKEDRSEVASIYLQGGCTFWVMWVQCLKERTTTVGVTPAVVGELWWQDSGWNLIFLALRAGYWGHTIHDEGNGNGTGNAWDCTAAVASSSFALLLLW
jgi:hypothetical protein